MRALYDQASIQELTGLTFDEFRKSPKQALAQAGQEDAPAIMRTGFRPLLPAQARIRAQLDADDALLSAKPMESLPCSQTAKPMESLLSSPTAVVTSLNAFRHRRRTA